MRWLRRPLRRRRHMALFDGPMYSIDGERSNGEAVWSWATSRDLAETIYKSNGGEMDRIKHQGWEAKK